MKQILVIYTWPPRDPRFLYFTIKFTESYYKHPSGIPHDVIVAVKDDTVSKFPFNIENISPLAGHIRKVEWLAVGDYGYDIGPFLRIARERQDEYDYVVLLGVYARILVDGWLKKLTDALDTYDVVSATGSFEKGISSYTRNPSLRTTAFAISPKLLTKLWPTTAENQSSVMHNKRECYEFEHGNHSIYRRAIALGRRGAVVGIDRAYPEKEWDQSCTFRKEEQRNLIVADNHTDTWMNSDTATRNFYTRLAGFTL